MIKEYKKSHTILTVHEIIYDQIYDCIKKEARRQNSYLEEIEDGVLSTLFTEPLNTSTVVNIGVQTNDIQGNPNLTCLASRENMSSIICGTYEVYEDEYDQEMELLRDLREFYMDDTGNLFYNPYANRHFYDGEDEDDYYHFFVGNDLNRVPELFDGAVGSLMDHLDEEACNEARGDIVKLLCERLKIQREQRRN